MTTNRERALAALHEALPRKRNMMERLPPDQAEVYEAAGGWEDGLNAVHDYKLRRAVDALVAAGLLCTDVDHDDEPADPPPCTCLPPKYDGDDGEDPLCPAHGREGMDAEWSPEPFSRP